MIRVYKHEGEQYAIVVVDDIGCLYLGYGDDPYDDYDDYDERIHAMKGDRVALEEGVWGKPIYEEPQ